MARESYTKVNDNDDSDIEGNSRTVQHNGHSNGHKMNRRQSITEAMAPIEPIDQLHEAAVKFETLTFGFFVFASFMMLVVWARHDKAVFVNTFFIQAIAGLAYFAKITGMSDATIYGVVVPITRYIDWIATTPLMLHELCVMAKATDASTTLIMGCDILMLAGGIISAVLNPDTEKTLKRMWFGISCFFYVLLVVILHMEVAPMAAHGPKEMELLFRRVQTLTVTTWSLYPIIVICGRAHIGYLNKAQEDILLCCTDIAAKVGMEALIICSVEGSRWHMHLTLDY